MLHSFPTILPFLCVYAVDNSIIINNFGFEKDGLDIDDSLYPVPPNTLYYNSVYSIIPDWTAYDPQDIDSTINEIMNPTGGDAFNDTIFSDDPPEGNQCGCIWQNNNDGFGNAEIGLYQHLIGNIVTPHTTYILTVYVGNSVSNCWSRESTERNKCMDSSGFPGYRVQLIAGNNVLAEDNDQMTIGEGEWGLSTVSYTAGIGDVNIGKTLGIRLIHKNTLSQAREICFDGVQLIEVQTPLTVYPTVDPTVNPTFNPTVYPTFNPTIYPTNSTYIRTQTLTNIPSNNPTQNPSKLSMFPSNINTVIRNSTVSPFRVSTTNSVSADDDRIGNNGSGSNIKMITYYGIIFSCSVFSVLCFCLLLKLIYHRYIKYKKLDADRNIGKDVLVIRWLEMIGLEQYSDNFLNNGYYNLNMVFSINNKEQLIEIGIHNTEHQTLLMSKIEKRRTVHPKEKIKRIERKETNDDQNKKHRKRAIPSLSEIPSSSTRNIIREQNVNVLVVEKLQQEDEDLMIEIENIIKGKKQTIGKYDEFVVEDNDDDCSTLEHDVDDVVNITIE